MNEYRGSKGKAPLSFNLGTRWAYFTLLPPYHLERTPVNPAK
jgi:hypothetical protein